MFSRRNNSSKNSGRGGGALTTHLFHRRLLPKSTSSRAAAGNAADVAGPGPTPPSRRWLEDGTSPVELVSVRRNTEQSTANAPASVEGRGVHVGGQLGLGVAVVRSSTTRMDVSSVAAPCSKSSEVVQDQRELSSVNHRAAVDNSRSDAVSVSVISPHVISDVQSNNNTGESSYLASFVLPHT